MEPEFANSRADHGNGLVQCFCLARRSSSRRRFGAEEGRQGTGAGGRVTSAEEAGGGVVRVRIVVSKRELKLMVAAAAASVSFDADRRRRRGSPEPLQGAEQLLQGLRRRHAQSAAGRIGRWSPALRSIPEEN